MKTVLKLAPAIGIAAILAACGSTMEQRAAAARALTNFNKAKAAHEKIRRQHEAEMAKYRSEIASK